VVVKNTLALRALKAAAAKVLTDFAKEFEKPALKAAIVDGRAVTPEQVKRMAQLPPRDVLLAELAGALQAPLAGFVGTLSGLLSTFVGAVEALRAQRESAA
jgi:large subunit ribosomal protein L10